VTRRKKIEEYVQNKYKVCPSCKNDSLKLCHSVKEQIKRDTCKCDGYPYPHKRGTKTKKYICRYYDNWRDINKSLGATKIEIKDDEVPF